MAKANDNKIPLYVKGTFVGFIENKIFHTTERKSEIHKFRMFNGYGLSVEVLAKLKSLGITIISFPIDGEEYFLRRETFETKGKDYINIQDGIEDPQKILSMEEIVDDHLNNM